MLAFKGVGRQATQPTSTGMTTENTTVKRWRFAQSSLGAPVGIFYAFFVAEKVFKLIEPILYFSLKLAP